MLTPKIKMTRKRVRQVNDLLHKLEKNRSTISPDIAFQIIDHTRSLCRDIVEQIEYLHSTIQAHKTNVL